MNNLIGKSDPTNYRPFPSTVLERWRKVSQRGVITPEHLLSLVSGIHHPDGTNIDKDLLLRTAKAWSQIISGNVEPSSIILCPNWQCETPIPEAVIFNSGCPHCGVRLRTKIRFPSLSESIKQAVERVILDPAKKIDYVISKIEAATFMKSQKYEFLDSRLLRKEKEELSRHISDILNHADRITIAIAGEKNRGKSTIANILLGLEDPETGQLIEAFPALHIVNTQVTKEVLLPGGRLLDLPGVNSLFEQQDIEAQRRIKDADAVVLVVNAKSPLMEPEFRFIRDHVLNPSICLSTEGRPSGTRRIVVALSKIDTLSSNRDQRIREIEEAKRYLLYGANGNQGLTALLPESEIKIVPVSAKWYSFYDLNKVKQQAEHKLIDIQRNIPLPPESSISIKLKGLSLIANETNCEFNSHIHLWINKALESLSISLGAKVFAVVGQRISRVPKPSIPSPEKISIIRKNLMPSITTILIAASTMIIILRSIGIQTWISAVASITIGFIAFLSYLLYSVHKIKLQASEYIRSSHQKWLNTVIDAFHKYGQNIINEGICALRDVPERMESGIPELVRAIEETISSNAIEMKVVEPSQSLLKICQDWTKRLEDTRRFVEALIKQHEKSIYEVHRHHIQAQEAVESAISSSLKELVGKLDSEIKKIVDKEISGFTNFFKILWNKEQSKPIQNVERRIRTEVINEKRIRDWIESDTLNRIQNGLTRVADRLQGALSDISNVTSVEIQKIMRASNLPVDKIKSHSLKAIGLVGAGTGTIIIGGIASYSLKGALVGSIGGPIGSIAGIIAGIVAGIIVSIIGLVLGIKGTNAMAEIRKTINTRLKEQLNDTIENKVMPAIIKEINEPISNIFNKEVQKIEKELEALKQDLTAVSQILAELNHIEEEIRISALKEVKRVFI